MNINFLQKAYISVASNDYSEGELIDMLSEFKKNNERNAISGILVYFNGTFCQVFEGPSEAVEHLWNNIKQDKRHNLVTEILNRSITDRMFSNWTMAFKVLNLADIESVYGFNGLLMAHKKNELMNSFKANQSISNDIVEMLASYTQ
ncbi:BLUF domain-containing protein [Aliikangiella sp. IMCC44632]